MISAFVLRALLLAAILAAPAAPSRQAAAGSTARRPAGDSPAGPHQIRLAERTRAAGIDLVNVTGTPEKHYIVDTIGSGAGWLDYDRDGRLDLYVTNGAGLETAPSGGVRPRPSEPNVLYRNRGDSTFEAVTAGVEDGGWAGGVIAADYDNDGFVDLYVTNLGDNALYRNRGDGTFETVASPALDVPGWSTSAAFADVDADGFLDLYVANYVDFPFADPPEPGSSRDCRFFGLPVMCGPRGLPGAADALLRNRGDGGFDSWQQETVGSYRLYGLGVVPLDVEGDGDIDLYVVNDSVPNLLWRNDGGRLTEVGTVSGAAASMDGLDQAGMGVDAADATGDGLPDLFVTNFSHDHNTFYVNAGNGRFRDRSVAAGVAGPSLPLLGWGARFVDIDSDGDLDILSVNGHTYPGVDDHDLGTSYRQPPQLFLNSGNGKFEALPFPLVGGEPRWTSRGAAFGDMDNDGDVDVHVVDTDAPGHLLVNETPGREWLGVQLVGRPSNRDGTGARLTVTTSDGVERVRWARPAGSYLSSNDPRVVVGLGDAEAVTMLEIRWPSGTMTRLENPGTQRWLVVVEGRGVTAIRLPGNDTVPPAATR